MGTGNYNATSNNMKLVQWPLMGGLLHLVRPTPTKRTGLDWTIVGRRIVSIHPVLSHPNHPILFHLAAVWNGVYCALQNKTVHVIKQAFTN